MYDGFRAPFIIFDDEKEEFVFIIKTNPCFGILLLLLLLLLFIFLINGYVNIYYDDGEAASANRFPDIRNKDGRLISPNEYSSKLEDKSIVMVDVHFKL